MKKCFLKLPRALFEGEYKGLTSDGKMLYSLLMDRHSLSEKNHFTDTSGNIVIYFTNLEICEKLGCGHDKATKLLLELEDFNLIHRRKQGRGKPDLIYVKKMLICGKRECHDADIQECGVSISCAVESEKPAGNYNHNSNNDYIHSDLAFDYEEVEDMIKTQIEYDIISERGYGSILNEIVDLITDTFCLAENYVRVAKRQIRTQTFRARIRKLTAEHIEYVIQSFEKHEGRIRNMRAYLLTAIYNVIDTLEAENLYGD